MGRKIVSAGILVVVFGAVLLAGCKDNLPASELDRFIARTEQLDGRALDDSLRSYMGRGAPYDVYANYLMGNKFYAEASDSAQVSGWGGEAVGALLDSAQFYLSRSVELDSTFIEGLVNLGSLWDDRSQQMGSSQDRDQKMAQAESYYRRALRVDPYDEKARCNLGSLFLRQRKTQEALEEFQGVIDHDPHSALAHYNLAIMFAESKIYREAQREWELASKYDPDGDIGDRSRANIKIVHDLMNAPVPDNVKK